MVRTTNGSAVIVHMWKEDKGITGNTNTIPDTRSLESNNYINNFLPAGLEISKH